MAETNQAAGPVLRSRWAYAGIGAGWLLAGCGALLAGGVRDGSFWAAPAGFGLALGVVYVGRAILPNRVRALLFRVRPAGLSRDRAQQRPRPKP